ncbi:MAG: ATP-grasp domain-containing protein [Minisyncoccia bacterium]
MKIGITYNLSPEAMASDETPNDRADEFDSIETVENIEKGIISAGHEPIRLGFGLEAMHKLEKEPVDLVFNIAEGLYGRAREAQMPALLDMMKIPYTFSDTLTTSLALNKTLTKQVLMAEGINTPDFWYVDTLNQLEEIINSGKINYPLFVKPSSEGSSMGINEKSRIASDEGLREQVALLLSMYPGSHALIETFLPGREVTVGVIGNEDPQILGIMSFRLLSGVEKDFFYTPEIKHNWEKYLVPECPAKLTPEEYEKVSTLALRVFKILHCRDCARIDIRFDANNEPSFVEINPLAGLTKGKSDIPVMAEFMGISYEKLIGRIIEETIKRIELEKKDSFQYIEKNHFQTVNVSQVK